MHKSPEEVSTESLLVTRSHICARYLFLTAALSTRKEIGDTQNLKSLRPGFELNEAKFQAPKEAGVVHVNFLPVLPGFVYLLYK